MVIREGFAAAAGVALASLLLATAMIPLIQ
jgi:hypothetical protein